MLIKNTPFDPFLSKSPNGERIIFMGSNFTNESTVINASSSSLQSANIMGLFSSVKYDSNLLEKVGSLYNFKFSGVVRINFSMTMTSASNGRLYGMNSNADDSQHIIGLDTGLTISASTTQAVTFNSTNAECFASQGAHFAFQLRLIAAGSITFLNLSSNKQRPFFIMTLTNSFS
jgi:hypothetical protein